MHGCWLNWPLLPVVLACLRSSQLEFKINRWVILMVIMPWWSAMQSCHDCRENRLCVATVSHCMPAYPCLQYLPITCDGNHMPTPPTALLGTHCRKQGFKPYIQRTWRSSPSRDTPLTWLHRVIYIAHAMNRHKVHCSRRSALRCTCKIRS